MTIIGKKKIYFKFERATLFETKSTFNFSIEQTLCNFSTTKIYLALTIEK